MAMNDKPVVLITGGNRSIGFQIAKDLASKGFSVAIGSRDLEKGEKAAREIGPSVHAVQLDVTDQRSISAAAEWMRAKFGRLDVLVQNAAIMTTGEHPGTIEKYVKAKHASIVSLDEMRTVFETNVFGVLAVYQAMLPLLRETPGARIVNVSSGSGSLTVASDKNLPYRAQFSPLYGASKTALNALTVAMAIELEPEGIPVNAVSPGFTRTAMNNFEGTDTVEDGAREAVRLALLGKDGPSGGFTHATFGAIPW
jgi:NAD(P)-dependent dehydrogenase (short-subunit alcohol dehydrogenase family)